MKILIDECAPKELKTFLNKHGHECLTVQEAGWSGKENGELLAVAETQLYALLFSELRALCVKIRLPQNPDRCAKLLWISRRGDTLPLHVLDTRRIRASH